MRKKRAIAICFALLALCAGLLAGCHRSASFIFEDGTQGDKKLTQLTMFGFKYEALNVMAIEDALHRYMAAYPQISIAYDGIKSPGYFDILEKRLATGNGDDIFMVDHERVLELGNQGKLADLSDLGTLDSFSELAKSQMWAQGVVHYVPTSISAFGLYCNLDLLKAHNQPVPTSLQEFEEVCDYFVNQGVIPIVANNDISLKTVAIARSLLSVYQREDTREALERFNDGRRDLAEALRPGFEFVRRMLDRGWVDAQEAAVTAKTQDDLKIFAQGTRPFMLTGAWAVSRMRELKPAFRFEVRPYPIMEDGSVLVINVDTRLSVNAASPYVAQAKQFVEFLTQKDILWEFVESQSSFSPLEENRLAGDAAIQSIGPYLTNGRSVFGSDDNLRFPIWDLTRQCVVGMLKGDDAGAAVSRLRQLLRQWEESNEEAQP